MKTVIAHKSNYGGVRDTRSIKYIVMHYTGNDGDTDTANAKYFQTANRGASAHCFVDDDSITQSVPYEYVAYHCGAKKYYHKHCRNVNSIGIEMCDTVKDGTYNVSKKTRANAIHLVQTLMHKYNIPIENVLRHYDVTHKNCPAYFVKGKKAWEQFKKELVGNVVKPKSTAKFKPYAVRVKANVLNIRSGAGTKYNVTGQIVNQGVYTIVEEKNGWGKLKSGAGWISLTHCNKI